MPMDKKEKEESVDVSVKSLGVVSCQCSRGWKGSTLKEFKIGRQKNKRDH